MAEEMTIARLETNWTAVTARVRVGQPLTQETVDALTTFGEESVRLIQKSHDELAINAHKLAQLEQTVTAFHDTHESNVRMAARLEDIKTTFDRSIATLEERQAAVDDDRRFLEDMRHQQIRAMARSAGDAHMRDLYRTSDESVRQVLESAMGREYIQFLTATPDEPEA